MIEFEEYYERVLEYPFRYHSVVSEKYAYIIDADGIVWIKHSKEGKYEAPCLAICVTHIICTDGWDKYQEIKGLIGEHLHPYKEECYEFYKKYDKTYMKRDEDE